MSHLNQPSSRPPPRAEPLLDLPGGPSAILRLDRALWCVLDGGGAFLRRGTLWTGVFGWADPVFEHLRFWELMHPEDVVTPAGFGHFAATRGPTRFTSRVLSAHSAYVHVEWCVERIVGERWLAVGHDVTTHALVSEHLREAEARYQILCNAAFEAVLIHQNGRIVDANPAACEMFGYSRRELIGRDTADLVAPTVRSRLAQRNRTEALDETTAAVVRRDGRTLEVAVRTRSVMVNGCTQRVVLIRPV